MTNEELGRRAVACQQWRWMPGMLARYDGGQGWYRVTDGYGLPVRHVPPNPRDAWPDLTDSATLGCLLALVREAWEGQFTVCGEEQLTPEALLAALEAAP